MHRRILTTAPILLLLSLASTWAFAPSTLLSSKTAAWSSVASSRRADVRTGASGMMMKDWSKRATLAEKEGGAMDEGFDKVGLVGTVPVIFEQKAKPVEPKRSLWRRIFRRGPSKRAIAAAEAANKEQPEMNVLKTMAIPGQPLSEVAAQAGQYIRYGCKRGECGTCAVRIDGQWERTCVKTVPAVAQGEDLKISVREGMIHVKKSSSFFSFSSFVAGFKNNALGMVGFVKESFKGKRNFQDRMSAEEELKAKVAARKAAKAKGSG